LQGSFLFFWLNNTATLANGIIIAYCLGAVCPSIDVANATVSGGAPVPAPAPAPPPAPTTAATA
jgi:hypothetical protein